MSKTCRNLRAFYCGKFSWTEMICVKNWHFATLAGRWQMAREWIHPRSWQMIPMTMIPTQEVAGAKQGEEGVVVSDGGPVWGERGFLFRLLQHWSSVCIWKGPTSGGLFWFSYNEIWFLKIGIIITITNLTDDKVRLNKERGSQQKRKTVTIDTKSLQVLPFQI